MKLKVKKSGETVETIIMELSPEEAIVLNHAMRIYAEDREVNVVDRLIMQHILSVEPIFQEEAAKE